MSAFRSKFVWTGLIVLGAVCSLLHDIANARDLRAVASLTRTRQETWIGSLRYFAAT